MYVDKFTDSQIKITPHFNANSGHDGSMNS